MALGIYNAEAMSSQRQLSSLIRAGFGCGSSKLNDTQFLSLWTLHLDNGASRSVVVACSEHLGIVWAM